MTDPIAITAPGVAAAVVMDRRMQARRAATRHSAHVRFLRRAMVGAAALGIAGIVLVTVFDPFHPGGQGLSIESTAIDGTKITMTNPKLAGFQKDGRPYAIEATRAVQDIKAPALFALFDLRARLVMADKAVTHLTAPTGAYNSVAETLDLTNGAHVVSDSGLDVTTQDAHVDLKANGLATDKPVSVIMPGRRIAADGMRIRDGGKAVTFEGHVHSEWVPVQQTAAADGTAATRSP